MSSVSDFFNRYYALPCLNCRSNILVTGLEKHMKYRISDVFQYGEEYTYTSGNDVIVMCLKCRIGFKVGGFIVDCPDEYYTNVSSTGPNPRIGGMPEDTQSGAVGKGGPKKPAGMQENARKRAPPSNASNSRYTRSLLHL